MLLRIRTVVAAAMLTVAAYATAVEMNGGHPSTYVVQKGDTLWDISAKFLTKPWLWPEIWQANPQVANPHLIYPGDVLSLAYLDRVQPQVTLQPGPRQAAPLTGVPLAAVAPFLKDLRVVDSVDHLPSIAALEGERLRATSGQLAYARGLENAQVGQRYAVLRPTVRYALPRPNTDLDARGRSIPGSGNLWEHFIVPSERHQTLGIELARVNVGTVRSLPAGKVDVATLRLDAQGDGREVRAGDRLVPVETIPYDLQFFPHPPAASTQGMDIRVLAVTDNFAAGGPRDVIALSVGSAQGADNGTVFSLWRQGRHVNDDMNHPQSSRIDDRLTDGAGRLSLPDEFAGRAMVFRTFENVSYALIVDGIKPVHVGYAARHPDAAP